MKNVNNVTNDEKSQARHTNLYEFLLKNYPYDFKVVGDSIHPKDNDSLSIKKGYCGYYDFATDDHGNSIDYLINYMEYEFVEAVKALCEFDDEVVGISCSYIHNYEENKKDNEPLEIRKDNIIFPEQDEFNSKLIAYLNKVRGIKENTIYCLIGLNLIYQDIYGNIVFANKERTWGERRGTNTFAEKRCDNRNECSRFEECKNQWCKHMDYCKDYKKSTFRGMIKNSQKDGYWAFKLTKEASEKVYVCEASIDAISLYELHKLDGIKENATYVSIGGCSKQAAIDKLKEYNKVIIAVDNDEAGEECRRRNSDLEYIIPKHKDWNEDLLARI